MIVNLGGPGPVAGPVYVRNGYSSDAAPLAVAVSKHHIITGIRDGVISLWSWEDLSKKLQRIASGEIESLSLGKEALESVDSGSLEGSSSGDQGALEKRRLEREFGNLLRELVAIKTISGNMCCKEDCFKAAKFVARLLENMGAEVKLVRALDDKNPVVIGRLGHRQDRPTVTFYGHYDVQPASEPQWQTDPFEVNAIDGYLYGRGVSDNKGPILAFIYAVREMLAESNGCEGLPVNVAFFFEGEEENGSKGTVEALQQNLRWFEGTVLTVISNSQWVGENVPCLTYGMRGMVSLNLEVRGPSRDLHSGNDGGVFNEPMADLIKVLSTLVDSQNNIQVPHFYDGVKPSLLDAAWQSLKDSDEFALDDYKETLGVPALTPHGSKHQLLSVRWCQPTLAIVDVCSRPLDAEGPSSYHRFGPTRFSVIPRAAVGKVSLRFVPKQDKEAMANCVTRHVEHEFAKLRSKNTISVTVVTAGDWWEANLDSKFVKMAEKAVRREWGRDPLYVREGGTMPLTSTFEKILGAPAMHIPMGQASDNCHLANERIRWVNLLCGKNVIRHLLEEVGSL